MGGLLIVPANGWQYAVDIALRTWLVFLGTAMAHEGSHGHLARTGAANRWWGRLALVPSMVPYANFRKTHLLHHRYTNLGNRDPDFFIKPGREWEIPLRSVAMPHHWILWLRKRGEFDRAHALELLLNYLGIVLCYLPILLAVGPSRLFWGMLPVLALVSLMLWYPFAYMTHEGFSQGPAATRSHDYFGLLAFWISFGLSMHRAHHLRPHYAWIELLQFVRKAPLGRWSWIPRRDIVPGREGEPPDAQVSADHARPSLPADGLRVASS